jgi:hypothetical protein
MARMDSDVLNIRNPVGLLGIAGAAAEDAADGFANMTLARSAVDRGVYRGNVPLAPDEQPGLFPLSFHRAAADFEYKVTATLRGSAGVGSTLAYPAAGTVTVTAIPS